MTSNEKIQNYKVVDLAVEDHWAEGDHIVNLVLLLCLPEMVCSYLLPEHLIYLIY